MLHLIKLLFNKDVLVFLIQMQYKKWKKQFITKGGWKKPKSIIIILLCKSNQILKVLSVMGFVYLLQIERVAAQKIYQRRTCLYYWWRKWSWSTHGYKISRTGMLCNNHRCK